MCAGAWVNSQWVELAGDVITVLKVTWMVRIEKWVVAW